MTQSHFHNNVFPLTPSPTNLSLTQKLISIYKLWHEFIPHFPKTSRNTLGLKIDGLFLEILELVFKGAYLTKQEKIICVKRASVKLDLLKFFLQMSWEVKSLDNKKYILFSEKLNEIGRMLGGWIKQLEKTPL